MILSLTGKDFDLAGSVTIDVPEPNFGDTRRRSFRIPTLDGGAVVDDFGFTDSDRTIRLTWPASASEEIVVSRLVRYHDRVRIGTPFGLMECIIDAYSSAGGIADLRLLVIDRISA